ncbi:dihydrofolate reductase [Jeotgalibacillus campisalis]|uniref:Dihydrofolate reductase n=1 Tax=Jeotgalibacillus campisalis TaxID=220754 RepID=A0A0C2S1T4_9BACL|nr:dihydrofolate reductase [Jeotgalibacillus campisalis]KIL47989.1 dihydrofolate reductase [Jeotgalibacillus campisalis]
MISIIVAHANNRVIGNENDMPWHLPKDLAYFKKMTVGKTLLMGRKTFESMKGPLKNRTNIVVTGNKNWSHEGAITVHSIEEGMELLRKKEEETFVIGGGFVYNSTIHLVDRLYVTVIELETDGDTRFPDYRASDWKEISSTPGIKDEKNPYHYTFKVYDRIHKKTAE